MQLSYITVFRPPRSMLPGHIGPECGTERLTYWLSQFGQYSSASSYSVISFLNAFLHFLHMNTISIVFASGCCWFSAWHSAHCSLAVDPEF